MALDIDELPVPRKVRASAVWALALPARLSRAIAFVMLLGGVLLFFASPRVPFVESMRFAHTKRVKGEVEVIQDIARGSFGKSQSECEVVYRFDVEGETMVGGSRVAEPVPHLGTLVDVEYVPANPRRSRIVGTSSGGVYETVTASIGLALVVASLLGALTLVRSGCRRAEALRVGQLGVAKLVSKEESFAFLGGAVAMCRFEVEVPPVDHVASYRTSPADPELRTFELELADSDALEVGRIEPFFYDADGHGFGTELAGTGIEVDARGELSSRESPAWKAAIAAFVIAAQLAMAWFAFA